MACSHRADCPLFPNLNSSLSGWRTHYCDTEEAWLNCARYTRSLAGKPVPVALLPNGKMAQILEPGAKANPHGGGRTTSHAATAGGPAGKTRATRAGHAPETAASATRGDRTGGTRPRRGG